MLSAIAFTYPSVAAGAKAVAPVVRFGTYPLRVSYIPGYRTQYSVLEIQGD
jgi:hypothetical protein